MFKRIKQYFIRATEPTIEELDEFDELNEDIDEFLNEPTPNVVNLIREQLKGITVNFNSGEENIENGMTENEKKELYSQAAILNKNKAFQAVISHLINVQGNYSMKEAEIMEHVAFGRATINGLSLMREEIARLTSLHNDSLIKEEDFDRHAGV